VRCRLRCVDLIEAITALAANAIQATSAKQSTCRCRRIMLRLCPAPHKSACSASPSSPLSQFLPSSPS
jgi:hypothetical protein